MALHSVAAEIRSIRGCVGCSVTTDLGNRSTVRYTEAWETEEHLRSRTQSDTFSHLFMLIEDAIQRPLIEFGIGRETRGFDFVTEVRASTG